MMPRDTEAAFDPLNRPIRTLADVRDKLLAGPADKPPGTALLVSAINTVARSLHCAPDDIPALPRELRARLNSISPAMAGLTTGSWSSVRSRVLKAILTTGVAAMPSRRKHALSPAWAPLYDALPNNPWQASLGRMIGYCSDHEYDPEQVCDVLIGRFEMALDGMSVRGRPRDIVHGAICGWNAAVDALLGWPRQRLSLPDTTRKGYVLPIAAFSPAFQASLETYMAYLKDPPDDDDAPLRGLEETTLVHREFQLRQMASALVHSGVGVEAIAAITGLTRREHVDTICTFFEQRQGRRDAPQIRDLLGLLRNIARQQLRDTAHADWIGRRLRRICNGRVRQTGMTQKNRKRLAVFGDPVVVRNLLLLPFKLLKRAESGTVSPQEAARLVRAAVAIELEIMCPVRLANLAELDIDIDFTRSRPGRDARVRLYIPGDRTKNDEDVEMEIPDQSMVLIDLFVKKYRNALIDPEHRGGNTRPLFPKSNGEAKVGKVLAESVCTILKRELGIDFNMHLFRHLGCFLYLRRHPGQFDVMRRVLGHKSVETTLRFYTNILNHEAFRQFDDNILQLRDEFTRPGRQSVSPAPRRRR